MMLKPQQFSYLLILDFEATCVQYGKPDKCQEIIEMPVFAINTNTWFVEHQFHKYVSPTVNSKLTNFCTELTGITQEMVDGQQTIEQVLEEFDVWLTESGIKNNKFAFVTCGDWDLKHCLPSEAEYKGIALPEYFKEWINLKIAFKQYKGFFVKDMMEMLELISIKHQGRHHSGIDDVKNLTAIACRMGLDNYHWKITGRLD